MTPTDPLPLTYTGERYHPEFLDEMRQEHMHRYAWAQELVRGRDVVDLACGEGFGSAMLAGTARHVIGIDISEDVIRHASGRYQASNLTFKCANAVQLPLPDHSADIVVSFETIEHLDNQSGMIAEIRRVLRPDGFLIISSPNSKVYSQRQGHINEFHVHEMTGPEFKKLLRTQFPVLKLLGQRLSVASSILPSHDDTTGMASVFQDGERVERVVREIPETMYYVAIAAAKASFLPVVAGSFLVSTNYDVYWRMRDEAVQAHTELSRLTAESVRLADEKNRLAEESKALWSEKDRLAKECQRLVEEMQSVINETGKVWAEKDRLASECQRLSAEIQRLVGQLNDVWSEKNRLQRLASHVEELELRMEALEQNKLVLQGERQGLRRLEDILAEKASLNQEIELLQGLLKLAGDYLVPSWRKRIKPSRYFDPAYYKATNPDVAKGRVNPLVHYIRFGRKEGRLPTDPARTYDPT